MLSVGAADLPQACSCSPPDRSIYGTSWQGRGEDLWVPGQTKNGPLAKQVVRGMLNNDPSRGSRGMVPGKTFEVKLVRIALVAICASKYNCHVIKLASHYGQESRFDNKFPLLDF